MSALPPPAVVLLSGGLDSSVVLAISRTRGFEPHALTFRYGQRHAVELASAQRVARALRVENHLLLDLDLRRIGGSALTSSLNVPKDLPPEPESRIPVTYVPARNLVFLSVATSWAEAIGARDIFLGVSSVDYSGYPDCRPDFLGAFSAAANLGTRSGVEGHPFTIHAPLIDKTKAETIRWGLDLGVDFSLTHTCYDPEPTGRPCQRCESCQLRARGFAAAGLLDPLLDTP